MDEIIYCECYYLHSIVDSTLVIEHTHRIESQNVRVSKLNGEASQWRKTLQMSNFFWPQMLFKLCALAFVECYVEFAEHSMLDKHFGQCVCVCVFGRARSCVRITQTKRIQQTYICCFYVEPYALNV